MVIYVTNSNSSASLSIFWSHIKFSSIFQQVLILYGVPISYAFSFVCRNLCTNQFVLSIYLHIFSTDQGCNGNGGKANRAAGTNSLQTRPTCSDTGSDIDASGSGRQWP